MQTENIATVLITNIAMNIESSLSSGSFPNKFSSLSFFFFVGAEKKENLIAMNTFTRHFLHCCTALSFH